MSSRSEAAADSCPWEQPLGATPLPDYGFSLDGGRLPDPCWRWLMVRRGPYQLARNVGSGPVAIPSDGDAIELHAGGEAHLAAGSVKLPAMSAALVR